MQSYPDSPRVSSSAAYVHPRKKVIPDFIVDRQSLSYQKVFNWLWDQADDAGYVTVNVCRMSQDLSISRQTAYRVLNWFREIVLRRKGGRPFLEQIAGGSGGSSHPQYRLNWKALAAREQATVTPPNPYRENSRKDPTSDTSCEPVRHPNDQRPLNDQEIADLLTGIETWAEWGWDQKARRQMMRAVRNATWAWGFKPWAQKVTCNVMGQIVWSTRLEDMVDVARSAMRRLWEHVDRIRDWLNDLAQSSGVQGAVRALYGVFRKLIQDPSYVFRESTDAQELAHIKARIRGISAWLEARKAEYLNDQPCSQCERVHTPAEFENGVDVKGFEICFGYGRLLMSELRDHKDRIVNNPSHIHK